MKNVLLCLCFGLCATSSLFSQDDGKSEQRQAKGRLAWFVYTSLPEGLENPVSAMSGNDMIAVTLSKRSPSNPVKIPADGILRIVREVENLKEPDKSEYLTIAQAAVPESVDKALIILVPLEKSSSGLLFQARVQDLASFKGGDCLYLNMTNLKMGVELGNTKLEVKPGGLGIYDAPKATEPVNLPIRYSYYDPELKEWEVISSSTVVFYKTRREICIFSWDTRFNRVDYHGITFPVTQ